MSFVRHLRRAVLAHSYGHSTGHVAQLISPDVGSTSRAHLIARAAEVYARMLKKDVKREQRRRAVRWL